MSLFENRKKPILTIVAGRPGAGKSTLAQALARRIHCPLISRDSIKEGMVSTLGEKGPPGGRLAQDAAAAFFEVVALLLERGVTVVADAFFPEEYWKTQMGKLAPLAKINLIFCDVDADTAHQRMARRRTEDSHWDEFHHPPVNQKMAPPARYEVPDLGVPRLIVNCRGEYDPDVESIFRFTKA